MTDALTCLGCATQRYSCEHDAETEIARGVAELAESAERLVGLAKIFRADDDTLCLVHAVLTALGDYNHSRRVQCDNQREWMSAGNGGSAQSLASKSALQRASRNADSSRSGNSHTENGQPGHTSPRVFGWNPEMLTTKPANFSATNDGCAKSTESEKTHGEHGRG